MRSTKLRQTRDRVTSKEANFISPPVYFPPRIAASQYSLPKEYLSLPLGSVRRNGLFLQQFRQRVATIGCHLSPSSRVPSLSSERKAKLFFALEQEPPTHQVRYSTYKRALGRTESAIANSAHQPFSAAEICFCCSAGPPDYSPSSSSHDKYDLSSSSSICRIVLTIEIFDFPSEGD